MFNLEKRERFIIIFLVITLLAGLAVTFYKKSNSAVDVKIRSFEDADSMPAFEKININDADETALMRLPGVGQALARRIIAYRAANGNFLSIDGLKHIKGIKDNLFKKIKDKVAVE